jgi:cysteine desulfurase
MPGPAGLGPLGQLLGLLQRAGAVRQDVDLAAVAVVLDALTAAVLRAIQDHQGRPASPSPESLIDLFFSDATQAVGKIPVNVIDDDIDVMAFSAHKIYGPKGVGALYVRRKNPRVKISAQIDGGGHERGIRSGTLNVPGIVGLGKACDIAAAEMTPEGERLKALRDKFEKHVLALEGTAVNGDVNSRLPHVSNISFRFVDGNALMIGLNKTIAVSSGSACTSASPEPSHVLKALGLDDELAHSSLRFSLGRNTTEQEIDYAIELVTKTVKNLRETINI